MNELNVNLTKEDMLRAATVTFDEKSEVAHGLWKEYVRAYNRNAKSVRKPKKASDSLEDLEDYYECLDLYYAFSRSFNLKMDVEWVEREKTATSDKINNVLVNEIMKHVRRCRECGKELEWDYLYSICKECYDEFYNCRYYDDDFDEFDDEY